MNERLQCKHLRWIVGFIRRFDQLCSIWERFSSADLEFITAALVRGRTIREIASALSAARPYSLSPAQVHVDAKAAPAHWRANAEASIGEVKARTLATLAALEQEAWQAWEKSR